MNTVSQSTTCSVPDDINFAARKRLLSLPGEPLLNADWDQLLMMHYEVDPVLLQKVVPFELELYRGSAWISLVAFTLRDMRLRRFGRLGAALFSPIATHEFLNVRTYVKVREETGIYFLAEWLSNRLSVLLGPTLFGLPYRFGRIAYQHDTFKSTGIVSGSVCSSDHKDRFEYAARLLADDDFREAESGSLTE